MPQRTDLSVEGWTAFAFALARTGVCAYRAATQSVVHDEGLTFVSFLNGSWRSVYLNFNANNHVLFSLLTKLSIRFFGLSEFTLRLVSVFAGFALMMGIYRILQIAETTVILRWAALLTIGLHPLLLDFCIAARGYALALACLVWAIVFCMRGRNVATGLLLGLGISANLTVALPALGLLCSTFVLSREPILKRVQALFVGAILVVLVFAACCWGAISSMTPEQFISAGLPTIQLSLDSLIMTSLMATQHPGFLGYVSVAQFLQFVVIPMVMVLIAAAGLRMWRGNDSARTRFLPAAALGLACAGMVAGHQVLNLSYPVDRTGLPFVVLAGVAWAIAVGEFRNRWFTGLNVLFAVVLAAQFLTQFQIRAFQIWQYDQSTNQVALRLAEECRGKLPASVSIGATWIHQPALEFYRIYDQITALQPIQRQENVLRSPFDYYVLNAPDTQDPEVRQMEVLFSDSRAGVIVARPRR